MEKPETCNPNLSPRHTHTSETKPMLWGVEIERGDFTESQL